MDEAKNKYLIHWNVSNIGTHENMNQNIDAGENGPIRIGVYSANGGGKSTISRQFRLLSISQDKLTKSDKYITLGKNNAEFKFKLFNQENATEKYEFKISHSTDKIPQITNNSQLIFHVFNSDYVRESIEPDNFGQNKEIEGYIIGKDVVDLTIEKKELENIRGKYEQVKKNINLEITKAKSELQEQGIRASTNEFKNFTFENIIGDFSPSEEENFKSLKSSLKKLEGIPEDLQDVFFHRSFDVDISVVSDTVNDLKEKITISTLSAEFKEKIQTKEYFIKSGLELLDKNKSSCPFCEQELKESQLSLIDSYTAYVYDAETLYRNKLQEKIKGIISLKKSLEEKYQEFLKIKIGFDKNKSFFPSFQNEELSAIEDISKDPLWDKVIDLINSKITNISQIIDDNKITNINLLKGNIEKLVVSITDCIGKNNTKISKINSLMKNSGSEILFLKKRMCNAKYIEIKTILKTLLADESKIKEEGQKKASEIKESENKAKKLKKEIVADRFESLIQFVFSDKYTFDKENNYLKFKEHSLKNSVHDVLSDGEKNIIAFCYYIAETHTLITNENDYDKLFFVIDDPISSMDFNYTYSLCRILERLHEYFGYSNRRKLRFILFTHNIEFMSILLRNNVIQKKYVLIPSNFKELKKELVMPYHEHLSDIYKVANETQEPMHTTPNSMRHVLETIAKFEDPNQDLISFVDKYDDLKSCSSLYNMIQDLSHGVFRSQPAISSDDLKKGCKTILNFVANKYKGQIENIKKTV